MCTSTSSIGGTPAVALLLHSGNFGSPQLAAAIARDIATLAAAEQEVKKHMQEVKTTGTL
jgi:hypothetical protein